MPEGWVGWVGFDALLTVFERRQVCIGLVDPTFAACRASRQVQRKVSKRAEGAGRRNLRGAVRQVGPQLGLDLVDRRQARLQRRRHLAHELVFGHTHWVSDPARRVFRHEPVLFLAQQGWL
jgi:hypothetical protein